ncbi:MAG: GNAT family N-acetyltransferase [Clostridia bacterium]|nr:GNAT family N-acetyltransferase [Clostridia bacterium]
MNVRRAEKKDLEAVKNLLSQVLEVHAGIRPDLFISGTRKYTDEEILAIFADPETPVFVAEEEGCVLGYCFCAAQTRKSHVFREAKELYIDDLCVDEKARGKGVGRTLYEYADAWAKREGFDWLTLHVWEGNDSARAFYEGLGFGVRMTTMEKRL